MVGSGALVGERFELLARAGQGGMGVVYRARDRQSGAIVALKLLLKASPEAQARFAVEARVLAGLRHPGIVQHVADGVTPDGSPWLAMEWLEGHDLATRLRQGPLGLEETLALGADLADALAAAHARGVVHRDVKPTNVFLQGGRLAAARLLDFGVARVVGGEAGLTRTGVVVGTPQYMAPEQARASAQIDGRADLFALGCVLFECLAGRPPFTGASLLAIMAKIVYEETPRLAAHAAAPGVPAVVDALVGVLLEKEPGRRPAGARVVADDLRLLARQLPAGMAPAPAALASLAAPPAVLSQAENQLVSLVIARHAGGPAADPLAATAAPQSPVAGLIELTERHGGRLEHLVDSSLVIVFKGAGVAVDHAARAARLALALGERVPELRLALATGRGVMQGALPVGEAIDRAVALLDDKKGPAVLVDEVSAGLLEASFVIQDGAVIGARGDDDGVRPLLGRTTPYVGRDRELGALAAVLDECTSEGVARAVVVTGAPGVGKSRLRAEFLRGVRERGGVTVWGARGEPMKKGSAYALLAQLVRAAAGLGEGDGGPAAAARLHAHVARRVPAGDAGRVSDFLAELCGLRSEAPGRELLAARESPQLMGDQLRRAWEDLIAAETRAAPLILVIEDLQWGDLPTVKGVDGALRAAAGPLLVLAVARPGLDEVFPGLWAERNVTRLGLGELGKKACERLVVEMLGEAGVPVAAALAERAGGNAFFLEELIRAVAAGHGDRLPATVLAMVQGRLEALPAPARRVLRAASVFGDRFWDGGVDALLSDAAAGVHLPELVEREIVARRPESRFPGAAEHVFAHALLREAAYAMLTDEDRGLGHRLAGAWLEKAGETDAVVLAGHYERGGDRGPAARWFQRAAEQALDGNDLEAVLARAARAEELGAAPAAIAGLRLLEATAHHWRGEYAQGERAATEAMRLLMPLGAPWYRAAEEVAENSLPLGKTARLKTLGDALYPPRRAGEASGAFVSAAAITANQLYLAGEHAAASKLMERLEQAFARLGEAPPLVRARRHFARATAAIVAGDVGGLLEEAKLTIEQAEAAGDLRGAALMRTNLAFGQLEVGAWAEAEDTAARALAHAQRLGLAAVAAYARENLALARGRQGRWREALPLIDENLAAFVAMGAARNAALGRVTRAIGELEQGRGADAAATAERAIAEAAAIAPVRAYALAVLAQVRLAAGQVAEALVAADEAAGLVEKLGGIEEGEALVRLVHVRTLEAAGRGEEAAAAARRAAARLEERAAKILDEGLRRSFLEGVPENRETRELARELAGGVGGSAGG